MKQHLWWVITLIGSLILLFALVKFGSAPGTGGAPPATKLRTQVSEADHTQGPANAKVTIVEYSDFQCPACAVVQPLLSRLVLEFPNDVRFAYRHFPLKSIHINALLSAQASEAAGNQGKFWEMHDVLFNTQSQWSDMDDPLQFFASLAESIGADKNLFMTDITSQNVVARVNDSYNEASRLGLGGTPTLFINGSLIDTPSSYDALKELITSQIQS